jgi:hypothetical protein
LGLLGVSNAQDPFEGKPGEEQRGDKKPSKEVRKEQRPDGTDEKLGRMKREVQELHQAGRHEEAEKLERQLFAAVEKREATKRGETVAGSLRASPPS